MNSASELPELDRPPTYASVDPFHPTVDVNHQPCPDITFSTLSPTAGHEYDIVSSNNSDIQVRYGENVLYHVARYEAIGADDMIFFGRYDSHGQQLARAGFIQNSKDFKFYVGGLKNPAEDDWDVVRYGSDGKIFSSPYFRFEAPELEGKQNGKKKYHWKKTHESRLGASKFSTHDYKLIDEATDDVVAIYIENLKFGSVKGTIRFPRKPNERFEVACMVVLFGILEKSRRYWAAVARAFPP